MAKYVCFVRGSSFQWNVKNAVIKGGLESDKFVSYGCRWQLNFDLDEAGYMNICLEKLNSEKLTRTYVIHAFIKNACKETVSTHFYMLDDPDFVTEEIWWIHRGALDTYLTDGTLIFVVVFTPTDILKAEAKDEKVSDKSIQTSVNVCTVPDLENLSSDFYRLLDDGVQSDVTLKCEERSFPAHKSILSARSEVFSAMFLSDMTESSTGVVQISDVDASVLDQFLLYVYSGKLPDLSVDTASKLYAAADKYSVESLKNTCAKFIEENLTKENACKILVLADTHGDRHLKDSVLRFITGVELVQNKDVWFEFHNEHPKLAVEGLYHAYEAKCLSKVD